MSLLDCTSYSGFVLLNEWRICPLTCLLSIFVQYVDLRHLFYSLYIIQHPASHRFILKFFQKNHIYKLQLTHQVSRPMIPSVTRLVYWQCTAGPPLPFSLLTLATHTSKKYEQYIVHSMNLLYYYQYELRTYILQSYQAARERTFSKLVDIFHEIFIPFLYHNSKCYCKNVICVCNLKQKRSQVFRLTL